MAITFTEKRLKAIADARQILDAAKAQNRGMNADEVTRYDAFMAESDTLKATIERESVQTQLDRDASNRAAPFRANDGKQSADKDASITLRQDQRVVDAVRNAGCAYASETARGERLSLGKIVLAMATGNRAGMSDLEIRAMSEGTDSAGGYTVPDIVGARFIDRAREASTVFRAGAQTVPMTSEC